MFFFFSFLILLVKVQCVYYDGIVSFFFGYYPLIPALPCIDRSYLIYHKFQRNPFFFLQPISTLSCHGNFFAHYCGNCKHCNVCGRCLRSMDKWKDWITYGLSCVKGFRLRLIVHRSFALLFSVMRCFMFCISSRWETWYFANCSAFSLFDKRGKILWFL